MSVARSGRPEVWGATPAEVADTYPCDALMPNADGVWYRAVTVAADPATTYRWLCQLKIAPYSYDLVDNLGRPSPRSLTPGAEGLAVGQSVMTIFSITSFAVDERLTVRLTKPRALRLFGPFVLSYVVRDAGEGRTRLVVKLRTRATSRLGDLRRRLLAWGDLAMMRRQLLTLKSLAERDAGEVSRGG